MDIFFRKAKDVLDLMAGVTDPLSEQKDKFLEANGFFEVPGASKQLFLEIIFRQQLTCYFLAVKHGFVGMLLALAAMVNVRKFPLIEIKSNL